MKISKVTEIFLGMSSTSFVPSGSHIIYQVNAKWATIVEADKHIQRYFENAKEDAPLFDFASSHKRYIVESHVLGEDIPTIRTKRFKTSYSQFYEEKGIEKDPTVYTGTSPNWGSIALQVDMHITAYSRIIDQRLNHRPHHSHI